MNESIGQIIKRLRKERNLTQEELAEQLNIISAPAISKWENDTSMPDISQVVPLANLFGVPTDVLFGVYGTDYEEEVTERLTEIFRMYEHCQDGEEAPTALKILDKYRETMRLYPNNSTILVNAMAFAEEVLSCNGTELKKLIGQEGLDSLTHEISRWAKLVIRFSTSIDDVLFAKSRLINIHVRRKNWDDAYALADTFPREISDMRGIRMADLNHRAGQGQKEKEQRCYNIQALAGQLGNQAAALGDLYMREEKYEDALYCYSFMCDMVESLYRKEKYRPPFVYDHKPLYYFPAYCLMKLQRDDEAVALLEEGVQFILAQAENYNKKKKLDIPLLCECSFEYGFEELAEYSNAEIRLRDLVCNDDFKTLTDNPRYCSLVEKINSMIEY